MYYIENNDKVVLFDEDLQRLQSTIAFMPQYKDLEIKEVQEGYVIVDFELMTIEEKEQREQQQERERLDSLFLTPSDVERALYKAKGMDFEDLKALIQSQAPSIDMKALSIEFRANNFYRGVVVGGMRLIDVVGALLGYTPSDMDYLFEHKELPAVEDVNGSDEGAENAPEPAIEDEDQ